MINLTQEQIMQNWGVDNSDTPLVSIRCITYNHEFYITQTLDGFLMQKTTFPFEIIVHDDASTDNTAKIIQKYETKFPKIIKPIYEIENQYSKHDGSLSKIMNSACKGKYIASCEGDDYWIDENKLQMQINFLENNQEYGMCYTKCKSYSQEKKRFENNYGSKVKDFYDLLKNGNRIPTLTVCYKTYLIRKYFDEIQPNTKGWKMGDYPLWLYISCNSKIKYFNKSTAVYRVLPESASHSNNIEKQFSFRKSYYDIKQFFYKYFLDQEFTYNSEKLLFDTYYDLCFNKYNDAYRKKMVEIYMKNHFPDRKSRLLFYLSKKSFIFHLFIVLNRIRLLRKS